MSEEKSNRIAVTHLADGVALCLGRVTSDNQVWYPPIHLTKRHAKDLVQLLKAVIDHKDIHRMMSGHV